MASVTHSVCRAYKQNAIDNLVMDYQIEAFKRLCDREGGYKAVAEKIGANPQTLYQVYAGIAHPSGTPRGIGPQIRKKLTEVFPDWLLLVTDNVRPATTRGRVPVISWVAAGNLGEITDMYQPGEAEHWHDVHDTQPGSHAFALVVEGDSMTSPHPGERSFPEGTIIVVDPDRGYSAGDYVIAKDVNTQRATFKKLAQDGGRWFLKPLNPSYPTIEIDDPAVRVIGRVIEFRYGGKL